MGRRLKAAALVALLAAAAVAADGRRGSTIESIDFSTTTTSKKKYELRVPGRGARVRVRVKASVREGRLRLVVRDAAGRVRQDALLTAPRPSNYDVETGEEVSAAGVWTVEFEMKEAVGGYEFTFTQNDQ